MTLTDKRKEFNKQFHPVRDCSGKVKHLSCCQGCVDVVIEESDRLWFWIQQYRDKGVKEEREKVEREFVNLSPAFLPPKLKKGYLLAMTILKQSLVNLKENAKQKTS
jgi:hypothetical protein